MYQGVYKGKKGKWQAKMRQIKRGGEVVFERRSMTFLTEEDAARQWDMWMRERVLCTGEELRVNIPQHGGEKQIIKQSSWGCQCVCKSQTPCEVYYDASKRKFRAYGIGFFKTPESACSHYKNKNCLFSMLFHL